MRTRQFQTTHLAVIILLALSMGACVDKDETILDPGDAAAGVLLRASSGDVPGEAAFAELAAEVPGTAGFYFDDDILRVVVTDPGQKTRAVASMWDLITDGTVHLPRSVTHVTARDGSYAFSQLAGWKGALNLAFDEIPEMTSLDFDEVANRIVVGFEEGSLDQARLVLAQKLEALGIPTDAVQTREDRWVFDVAVPTTIRQRTDTAVGGVEVLFQDGGDWFVCSLGFTADYYGSDAVVTAAHCSPTMYWPDQSDLYQGATSAGDYLGWEYLDPAGSSCGVFDTCRQTDAALYYVNGDIPIAIGRIARTLYRSHSTSGSINWDTNNPYFIIREEAGGLYSGYQVNKMGRTTGWTYGSITGTCVTIDYGNERVTCAYEATYHSDGGDSGGSVFMWEGGGSAVTIAGVHSGRNEATGKRFFSRVADIKSELGAMTVARGANLSTPSLGGSVQSGSPRLSWGSVAGAGSYHVFREIHNAGGSCTAQARTYLGATSATAYWDPINATAYLGTYQPGPRVDCYASYQIYASSSADVSDDSNWVYFSIP